jgi:diaminohydroxyphosphoribosylaminopyrimidine deaminase/5-amino-6-(5-phosphoribosylamino)uracil reductase
MNETYMRYALSLAKKTPVRVSPNPFVGAVLVKDHKVLATGSHQGPGTPHAEAQAFQKLSSSSEAYGADLYVTLEPCCHTSKRTPPCLPLILEHKIQNVFVAMLDPNPSVSGKSVEALRMAGINVHVGLCEGEAKELNYLFHHWVEQNLTRPPGQTPKPFIHAKIATSLDGFYALKNGTSKWITDASARTHARNQRLNYEAWVIGGETLRLDRPQFFDASVPQELAPWRLILTKSGHIPLESSLFHDPWSPKTRVLTGLDAKIKNLDEKFIWRLPLGESWAQFPWEDFYKLCAQEKITSLWVEAGGTIVAHFLNSGQWNRFSHYQEPFFLGEGRQLHHSPQPLSGKRFKCLTQESFQTSFMNLFVRI